MARERSWPAFEFDVELVGGIHVVHLRGEVDLAVADRMRVALVGAGGSTVVADLTAVTLMDASALHALLTAKEELARRGHILRVEGAHGIVRKAFAIAGLDDQLAG